MTEMKFTQAVNQALRDAMTQDDTVMLLGEDIAAAGGSFKATRDLLDTFGPERVRDTPISESSLASLAVGAAMTGMKPVVEIMFMDFITLAMDALVNQAAKARFMFGGRSSVPMVLRTPHGGGLNAGPQHSQCLEAWLAHIPGLKVVCPSTPGDVYGLLRSAINDPDPVVFIEHKAMYGRKGPVDTDQLIPLGQARIARPGRDVTLVTYGATVHACLTAADRLAGEGVEAEVIDLRTLQPLDMDTILASLRRTHRIVIVHEAVQAFGVGAEIAARVADEGFDELDAPVLRVGAPFMPVPFARSLEARYMVDAGKVCDAVKKVMA
ncbi:alpha-ketoacid dehydrogenase subunit beta [Pollutimonas harenae]|uniref:Alpha-ketoacid dehydrogenase subunit beta n=1 Tax=Pollutimonas harenae TaxID=657015 RepID=A0A853H0Q8_9BURK|nr:alpha-ketoacid dehydrogenase subunit beta [Pollutimonas harenae]NYT84845.1 alpha-ketoacid dehydrogenase subunit beta [Pollutimonas harenae]TEA72757.1 alpha-ketoacid dehydrogenase subunit beta [Pollutimonas harenae]